MIIALAVALLGVTEATPKAMAATVGEISYNEVSVLGYTFTWSQRYLVLDSNNQFTLASSATGKDYVAWYEVKSSNGESNVLHLGNQCNKLSLKDAFDVPFVAVDYSSSDTAYFDVVMEGGTVLLTVKEDQPFVEVKGNVETPSIGGEGKLTLAHEYGSAHQEGGTIYGIKASHGLNLKGKIDLSLLDSDKCNGTHGKVYGLYGGSVYILEDSSFHYVGYRNNPSTVMGADYGLAICATSTTPISILTTGKVEINMGGAGIDYNTALSSLDLYSCSELAILVKNGDGLGSIAVDTFEIDSDRFAANHILADGRIGLLCKQVTLETGAPVGIHVTGGNLIFDSISIGNYIIDKYVTDDWNTFGGQQLQVACFEYDLDGSEYRDFFDEFVSEDIEFDGDNGKYSFTVPKDKTEVEVKGTYRLYNDDIINPNHYIEYVDSCDMITVHIDFAGALGVTEAPTLVRESDDETVAEFEVVKDKQYAVDVLSIGKHALSPDRYYIAFYNENVDQKGIVELFDVSFHDLICVAQEDPTCTEDGTLAYYGCQNCGKMFRDALGLDEIPFADWEESVRLDKLGHDWGPWTVTKEPTATQEGEWERVCGQCDLKETGAAPTARLLEQPEKCYYYVKDEPAEIIVETSFTPKNVIVYDVNKGSNYSTTPEINGTRISLSIESTSTYMLKIYGGDNYVESDEFEVKTISFVAWPNKGESDEDPDLVVYDPNRFPDGKTLIEWTLTGEPDEMWMIPEDDVELEPFELDFDKDLQCAYIDGSCAILGQNVKYVLRAYFGGGSVDSPEFVVALGYSYSVTYYLNEDSDESKIVYYKDSDELVGPAADLFGYRSTETDCMSLDYWHYNGVSYDLTPEESSGNGLFADLTAYGIWRKKAHETGVGNYCSVCGYSKTQIVEEGGKQYLTMAVDPVIAGQGVDLGRFVSQIGECDFAALTIGDHRIVFDKIAVQKILLSDQKQLAFKTIDTTADGDVLGVEYSLSVQLAEGQSYIRLQLPDELPQGHKVIVRRVDGDNKQVLQADYADGKVQFDLGQAATYAVRFEQEMVESKKGLSGGAIAGIVIGVVAFLAAVAVGCLFLLKKKGVLQFKKSNNNDGDTPIDEHNEAIAAQESASNDLPIVAEAMTEEKAKDSVSTANEPIDELETASGEEHKEEQDEVSADSEREDEIALDKDTPAQNAEDDGNQDE